MDFEWRLRELMTERGITHSVELRDHLAKHDIALSRHQVFRLINQKPERLSLQTLMALCEILSCNPTDLIRPLRESPTPRPLGFSRPPAFVVKRR